MKHYIFKKLLYTIPVLLGITWICFYLTHIIPGNPVETLVGKSASPETIETYYKELGLDRPLLIQYFQYTKMLLSGHWGISYYTKEPVWNTFLEKLPNTLLLATVSILFATFTGIFLGIIASLFSKEKLDECIILLSTTGISIPVFWWGLLLMLLFSYILKLLPPSGTGLFPYIILPALTLGTRSIAYITMITRASMLETFKQPFILSLKALGFSRVLLIKHSLRNALIPVITIIALDFGSYLSGAVLTETIFGWDGIGKWVVDAIFRRDYPIIMLVVLWGAITFILIHLVIDIICFFLNPKLREGLNKK